MPTPVADSAAGVVSHHRLTHESLHLGPIRTREEAVIGKLGLIMVVVSDMQKSVAFYRDVLGLKLLFSTPGWSQFDCGGIMIGLHPEGAEVKVSPTTGVMFGMYVDDIERTVTELQAKGANIAIQPRQERFGRLALVHDPDGYGIQIAQISAVAKATP